MKKINVILLLAAFFIVCNVGYCGTVAPPYQVGTWSGFRTAAVSYVSDAGYLSNLYTIAVPMFNSYGFKLSMFEIPNWNPPWSSVQAAVAQGHEASSLLMDHGNLPDMNETQATWELSQSQIVINSYIQPGSQCLIVGYPNCNIAYKSLIAQYYIAARTCGVSINPSTPPDFYAIDSLIVGSATTQGLNSTAGFITKDNQAASMGGWVVYLVHDINNQGGYSPISATILNESLQYLDNNRNTFWVQNFGNVVRYIKERNDASVSETSNTGDTITLSVTDTLNDVNYCYPITIRRPLPAGWGSANVSQNGLPVPSSIVKVNSTAYVMFDVVPDRGEVVLSRGIYGDFTGDGVVDMNDLSGFLKFWLVNDCNGIVGLDVDEDCVVNFDEFAVLAESWRQEPS
jgi:oligosaccharide reducing-end xylanase